jgi:predicted nucleotidyltransferase
MMADGAAMITSYTSADFYKTFAYNERRKHLYGLFMEELEIIRSQCAIVRVLVFGSYITGKEEPRDIDLLLSLIADSECVYEVWTKGLRLTHPDEVDVQYYKTQLYIKDAESLLKHFNANPKNELYGIAINDAAEIIEF